MKKIKVAIIGFGHIAKKFHYPIWKNIKSVNDIILVDKNKSSFKNYLKKKVKKIFTNSKKLYKLEKIDISAICTPPAMHFQNIIDAISNNTHTFVEKPFLIKYKDFLKIKKIKKKNKIITCAYHQRFRPVSKKVKDIIEKKLIGDIYLITIKKINFNGIPKQSHYFSSKKFSGGGPLIDYGSHYFDLVSWYLNFPKIKKIDCYTFDKLVKTDKNKKFLPFKKFNNEEFASGQILFANNCLVNFELGYRLNTSKNITEIKIYGTKGMINWPKGEIYKLENSYLKKKKILFDKKKLASEDQIKNFLSSIKDKNKLLVKFNEIGYNIKLIESLYNVAKKND